MHLKENLINELSARHEAWVMANAVIYITDGNGTNRLGKLLSKDIFFYDLKDGKTLMTRWGMEDRLFNKAEIAEISDLVYFEQPLDIAIFEEVSSLAPGETVKISSKLVWCIIPESAKTPTFCRWHNLLVPQRRW